MHLDPVTFWSFVSGLVGIVAGAVVMFVDRRA